MQSELVRGTIISIILVMFVLPQILLVGGSLVDKTSFSVPKVAERKTAKGRIRVDDFVQGEMHGAIRGAVNAVIDGDVNLKLISGTVTEENAEDEQQ